MEPLMKPNMTGGVNLTKKQNMLDGLVDKNLSQIRYDNFPIGFRSWGKHYVRGRKSSGFTVRNTSKR